MSNIKVFHCYILSQNQNIHTNMSNSLSNGKTISDLHDTEHINESRDSSVNALVRALSCDRIKNTYDPRDRKRGAMFKNLCGA